MATVTTDQIHAYESGWNWYGEKWAPGTALEKRQDYMDSLDVYEQFKPDLEEAWTAGWSDAFNHRPKWHRLECLKDEHGDC